MPKEAKGEVRRTLDGFVAVITIKGTERKSFDMPTCRTDAEAHERSDVLAKLAKRFRRAGLAGTSETLRLLEMVGVSAPALLPSVLKVADKLAGGELAPAAANTVPTFGAIGKQWTRGDLHKKYPDYVAAKDSEQDERRIKVLCGLDVGGMKLGDIPIDRFTLEHAERAMQSLPERCKRPATRRAYAQVMSRTVALAVYPLRLIDHSPLPKGFLPKIGRPPAFPYLFPAEDASLMACTEVPFCDRLLFGVLAREGLRAGEAAALQFRDLDLDNGSISLPENKTDDPRTWALDSSVVGVLKAWKEQRKAEPDDHVFVDDNMGSYDLTKLADRLRTDLKTAGVTRLELFETSRLRGRLRVHDLRASFVTLALANGRTETWVADRTGHRSSVMINRYRRQARAAAELELGDLQPLADVLAKADSHSDSHSEQKTEARERRKDKLFQTHGPLGGMADAEDLKSSTLTGIPVRVREGLPSSVIVNIRA